MIKPKVLQEPITFVSWKWKPKGYRTTYTAEHVNIWAAGIKRHYKYPHRLICVTDDPTGIDIETFPLWDDCDKLKNPNGNHLPSCYRRLKIFSPMVTSEMDIEENALVASIDLDVVFVNDLQPMLHSKGGGEFVGWKGPGAMHPTVYNGTFFMFRAGRMAHLWEDFDGNQSPALAANAKYFGSDQGWLSYKLAGRAPGFTPRDGLFSYSRDVRAARISVLPRHAKIISFNGKLKPWDAVAQSESPWIKQHWRL